MRLKLILLVALFFGVATESANCQATEIPSFWTAPVKLEGMSASRVSAVWYNEQLHIVHGGKNNDELWHAWWDGREWSRNRVSTLPAENRGTPALAVFKNSLHIVYKSVNNTLWHATSQGQNWTSLGQIPGQKTYYSPSMVAYPYNHSTGQPDNRLWMFHSGAASDNKQYLWDSYFNGVAWSDDQKGPGVSQNAVTHSMHNGRLYRASVYESSITFNTYVNAVGWHQASAVPQLPNSARSTTPIALASDGRSLYAFYRHSRSGAGSEEPVHAAVFTGSTWQTPRAIKDFVTSDGLAVVAVPGDSIQLYLFFTRGKDIYFTGTQSLKPMPLRPLLQRAN